jgi:hypothetical protein
MLSGVVIEVSNSTTGSQANGDSFNSNITPDGRFVVFESYASNLVPDDTSRTGDIFVKDLKTGRLVRVSTTSNGQEANGRSYSPSISSDGRLVAFRSDASNLVSNDTNGVGDIFVKNMLTGEIRLVSLNVDGILGNNHSFEPSISADGSTVVFRSYASNLVPGPDSNLEDIYARNLLNGEIVRVNTSSSGVQGNNAIWYPTVSANGRYVAFPSTANNLVPGDTNNAWDVFVKDLQTGLTTRVSTNISGVQANGISNFASINADGTRVAFLSFASNLVASDTNAKADIFVKDLTDGTTTRVSSSSTGAEANNASVDSIINSTGMFVAFSSSASNLVSGDTNNFQDVFVKNLATGQTLRASTADASHLVGTVTAIDQDVEDSISFSLSGTGSENFLFDRWSGAIYLTSNALIDYGTNPTYNLSLSASDGVATTSIPLTLQIAQGYLVQGTNANDAFIVSYIGDGTTSEWSITRNGQNVFTGAIPTGEPLVIHGLVGADTLTVAGTNTSDTIRLLGNRIEVNGFSVVAYAVESLRTQGLGGDDTFVYISGTGSFDGGLGLDQVSLPSGNGEWILTGMGIGTLNTDVSFIGVESLGGSEGNDVFRFGQSGAIVGKVQGGNGIDTLHFGQKTTAVTINLATKTTSSSGVFEGIETVIGGINSSDVIVGDNSANQWNITGVNRGNIPRSGVVFESFERLTGGTSSDQFVFDAQGRLTGNINGGTGVDTIQLANRTDAIEVRLGTVPSVTNIAGGFTAVEQVIGNGLATSKIVGSSNPTSWSVNTAGHITVGAVAYHAVGNIEAGTGIDTLTGPALANTWTLESSNSGSLNTGAASIAFSGIENLTGNIASDQFVFEAQGRLTGNINGGTGVDTIQLANRTDAIEVRLGTVPSVTNIAGGFTAVEQVIGNGLATSKIVGSSNSTSWSVNTAGHITVGTVVYHAVGNIEAGTGIDTLTGPALANTWTLASSNSGSLNIGTASVEFSGVENLTGNVFEDDFSVLPSGTLSGNLNGGSGSGLNTLSYSQWTVGVAVDLSVTTLANATAIAGLTSNIQIATGGFGNDTLKGQSGKSTILIGLAGNDTLVGGNQRDLLFGGSGADILNGREGDDLIVSGTTSYDANRIALIQIHSEWISTRTFAVRTANLWGNGSGPRSNLNTFLNSNPADDFTDSVFSDGFVDSLTGGLNQDWFFADLSETSDFIGTGTAPDRLDS